MFSCDPTIVAKTNVISEVDSDDGLVRMNPESPNQGSRCQPNHHAPLITSKGLNHPSTHIQEWGVFFKLTTAISPAQDGVEQEMH
jgi:hypothetical protein